MVFFLALITAISQLLLCFPLFSIQSQNHVHCIDLKLHNRNKKTFFLKIIFENVNYCPQKRCITQNIACDICDWAHTYIIHRNHMKYIDSCSFVSSTYYMYMSRVVMLWNAIGIQTLWYERLETIQIICRRRGLLLLR